MNQRHKDFLHALSAWKQRWSEYRQEPVDERRVFAMLKGLTQYEFRLVIEAEIPHLTRCALTLLKTQQDTRAVKRLRRRAEKILRIPITDAPKRKPELFTRQFIKSPELIAAQKALVAKMKLESRRYARSLLASQIGVKPSDLSRPLVDAKAAHLMVVRILRKESE